ncbi:RND family transporter [Maricurvus nonylphenolicus]|uniref:efflux RND transporter permease subunit n=1 Tax=Maricurvus nonylphenolicus TaxID=1008307 RepID=UPI0036F393B1
MSHFMRLYTSTIIRYRWLVMLAMVLITAVFVVGASRLGVNTDIRVFFSEDNPQLLDFEALENTYTKNDNIFIAISAKDKTVFNRDTLAVIEALTKESWTIPYSSRVDSLTNFKHSYAQGDELIVEDLVRHADRLSAERLTEVEQIALSEPLLINRLISEDARVTGINIDVIKPDSGENVAPEIADFVRQLVADYQLRYPELEFYLTGWIMIDSTMGEGAERDMQDLIPAMFLVLILVMGFCLKSVSGTLAAVLVIILSMLVGLGAGGWMGIKISGPSSTAPPIILTLALADSIHVLLTIFQRMYQGDNRYRAIITSLKINMRPLFITSATTLLGFLSMNYSDVPPFRDLGNMVAVGIAAAFFYSVMLLPALMAVLLPKHMVAKEKAKRDTALVRRFSAVVIQYRQGIMWFTTALALVISLGIYRIELNDDFIRYFDESYDYRVDSEFVMDNLTGLYTIEYSLDSGQSKGIHDPDFLRHVEKFSAWYETQPEVTHVNSLIPILKKLNMNINADDPRYYRIPDDTNKIAQYLLLFELSLPFGQDLNNQINVDKSSLRMTVSLTDVTANDVRAIDARAQAWLKDNVPAHMISEGTGLAVMYAHLSERNIKSMLAATFGALVLISFILIFAFRSIKYGLMSLIPNLAPAIMAFGVWGFTMQTIGMPAAVLVSLAVGIIVDDTVHFISKYLHARRSLNKPPYEAIHYTFETVGKALLITTVTLVVGFSVLSLSGYKPNSDMGIMTGIIISVALIFDFLFLPVLMLMLDDTKEAEEESIESPSQAVTEDKSIYSLEGN